MATALTIASSRWAPGLQAPPAAAGRRAALSSPRRRLVVRAYKVGVGGQVLCVEC